MKQLPEDISANIVDTVFKGKKRGLRNLAFRQAQDGQWIDDNGVVALATAYLLQRNISVQGSLLFSKFEFFYKARFEGFEFFIRWPYAVFHKMQVVFYKSAHFMYL